jgi:hypothetical protein
MTTYILTGSPENHEVTRAHGYTVIGLKERHHRQALELEVGDRLVLYLTKVKVFCASMVLDGPMFEARERLWPGAPKKPDIYPWRFPARPEVVIEDAARWIDAGTLAGQLEHVRKWPAEHWTLAFQGQLRAVSDADAAVLLDALRDAAGVPV